MENQAEKTVNQESLPLPAPVQSKTTRLQATIDRQAKQKSEPLQQETAPVIHRFSNGATEKDGPPGKWCSGQIVTIEDHASVLDVDVTCPDCLKVIDERKALSEHEPEKNPGIAAEVTKQMQGKFAASDKPASPPEPAIEEVKSYASEIVLELLEKRKAAFEMQQAEVNVLSDIAECIKNIAETLNAMNIRDELIYTLNSKEIDRSA